MSAPERRHRRPHSISDSAAFAQMWNAGRRNRKDIKGRVVIGFKVASRQAVDDTYADLTGAGYTGCSRRATRSGARALRSSRTRTVSRSAS
jgi:hypothetical protein